MSDLPATGDEAAAAAIGCLFNAMMRHLMITDRHGAHGTLLFFDALIDGSLSDGPIRQALKTQIQVQKAVFVAMAQQ